MVIRKRKGPQGKKTKGFKSKFESLFAQNLKKSKIPFEYETIKVKYVKEHTYCLDFSLSNGKILIETKGYFTAADRQKMLDVKKAHPELDIRLVFMANQKIHKLSDTRYGDWCDKHGFKWTVSKEGKLPDEWKKELRKADK
jgi:hypothetical protein